MIHLWQGPPATPPLFTLSHLYPSKLNSFYILAALAAILLLAWLVSHLFKTTPKPPPGFVFVVATLAQAAFYILHLGFIDEVFVNLDHPWNLYHHGTFSFQPDQLNDGTVEFLYYLLLTPFAGSRAQLIQALMLQGWLVAFAHLVVLRWMLHHESPAVRHTTLLTFACHPTINQVFAGGFGNGLVSLLFLASFACLWRGRYTTASLIAAALPLVRIDSILYVLPLAVIAYRLTNRKRIPILTVTGAIGSVLLILALHRIGYGTWVPTPILFKSMPFSILIRSIPRLPNALVALFIQPAHLIILAFILAGFAALRADARTAATLRCIPYFIAVSLFYYVQARINPPDRYYLPMNILLVVLAGFGAGSLINSIQLKVPAQRHPLEGLVNSHTALLLGLALLQSAVEARRISLVGLDTHFNTSPFPGPVIRNDSIVYDALTLQTLIPAESQWRTASTELDTFGFFLNRPILPLWGYANRELAVSHTFNVMDIRCDPNLLTRARPELFWVWHRTLDPRLRVYQPTEDPLFFLFLEINGLGSPEFIIDNYHLAIIDRGTHATQVLVRSDIWPEFEKNLLVTGYKQIQKRPWNTQAIREHIKQNPPRLRTL